MARAAWIGAAQHVIGAELEDHRIRPLRHRPVQAGKPAGRSVAGHPGIGDLHRDALGLERPLKLRREGFLDRQAKPGSERIAQGHDAYRLIGGCGGGRTE